MNRETFEKQLRELFSGEKLYLSWVDETNAAIIKFHRRLTRLEIGHLFSLGVEGISGTNDGLLIAFLLDKASLNNIYSPQIIK